MLITENGEKGIFLDAEYGRLLHSTITDNKQTGINCVWTCLLEGNMLSGNGSSGASIYVGSVIGNVIVNNKSWGLMTGKRVGYGNNTIADNNGGGKQIWQDYTPLRLFPNACYPGVCP